MSHPIISRRERLELWAPSRDEVSPWFKAPATEKVTVYLWGLVDDAWLFLVTFGSPCPDSVIPGWQRFR